MRKFKNLVAIFIEWTELEKKYSHHFGLIDCPVDICIWEMKKNLLKNSWQTEPNWNWWLNFLFDVRCLDCFFRLHGIKVDFQVFFCSFIQQFHSCARIITKRKKMISIHFVIILFPFQVIFWVDSVFRNIIYSKFRNEKLKLFFHLKWMNEKIEFAIRGS